MIYVGHFPNTKHHIRLQMYRDEQKVSNDVIMLLYHMNIFNYIIPYQEWIKEEEMVITERNRDRDVDAKRQTREVVRKRAWKYFQAVYKYIMD